MASKDATLVLTISLHRPVYV